MNLPGIYNSHEIGRSITYEIICAAPRTPPNRVFVVWKPNLQSMIYCKHRDDIAREK